jgi:hypothetical protein
MKINLTIILFFFSLSVFGQNIDSCGIDNNSKLTSFESDFLNNYLKESRDTFNFKEKKIIFVTYPSGNKIGTKVEYFTEIKNWDLKYKDNEGITESNKKIATTLITLTEKEKNDSGGYDAILTYWVKFLTNNQKKKVIKQIKTCH